MEYSGVNSQDPEESIGYLRSIPSESMFFHSEISVYDIADCSLMVKYDDTIFVQFLASQHGRLTM